MADIPVQRWILPDPAASTSCVSPSGDELALRSVPVPDCWQCPKPAELKQLHQERSANFKARYLSGCTVCLVFSSFFYFDREVDLEQAKASTVRNGVSIARRQSGPAAALAADTEFGQSVGMLGPPTGEDVGDLCIWVGVTEFSEDDYPTPTCCVVRLVEFRADSDVALVETLQASEDESGLGISRAFVE